MRSHRHNLEKEQLDQKYCGVLAVSLLAMGLNGCGQATSATLADTGLDADAPQAQAGDDLFVLPGQTVTLDGSASSDPQDDALSFSWTQSGGTPQVTANGPQDRPTLSWTAPEVTDETTLTFVLTVSDGRDSDTDDVQVTIEPLFTAATAGWFADAGPDQCVWESNIVTLDATAGLPTQQGMTVTWTQQAGPTVQLADLNAAATTFVAPLVHGAAEAVVLQLEISDGIRTAVDQVTITILPDSQQARACGAPHDTIRFETSAVSGPAPLQFTVRALSTTGELPVDGRLTWIIDEEEMESGSMKTHARLSRTFRTPGVHTIGLCVALAGVNWSCMSAEERETRRQLTVWPAISGRIVEGTTGVSGVVISANNVAGGATAVTDSGGHFRIDVPYGWSGVITPDHFAYAFSPSRVLLQDVTAQVANLQFDAAKDAGGVAGQPQNNGDTTVVAIPLQDCVQDADCDDTLFCNGIEMCVAGQCSSGSAPCVAQQQICSEAQDTCMTTPECQTDADCNDGQYCNGVELCQAGACQKGASPCTQLCDEALNTCVECFNDTHCNDGVFCNGAEQCLSGVCLTGQSPCAAGSTCDENTAACVACLADDACDDGLFCNGIETCQGGNCSSGTAPCAAGQTCNEAADLCEAPPACADDSQCDDSLYCNGFETCANGNCVSGTSPCSVDQICDEQQDLCTAAAECAAHADCDDAQFCNGSETCVNGSCVAGTAPCAAGQNCNESGNLCEVAGAWEPPVGIPAPTFGVEETAPAYDTANALHYYVDNSHPAATNSGNPNGSPEHPRSTIPMDLAAGAVVEVRGGPYNYASLGGKMYVSGSGTPDEPVFIRGPGVTERPVFTRDLFVKGSYIILEHLHFDDHGVELRPVNGGFHHIAVRHSEFAGDGQPGGGGTIKVVGNPTLVTDIVLYDNHIHDNGNDAVDAPDQGRHGILVSYNVERCWVIDNTIHDNNADSIQVNFHGSVSPKVPARYVYIGRNTMYGDRENAVDLKVCQDVIVSENDIHSYTNSQSSSGEAIVIHTGQTLPAYTRPENVWVLHNDIHDSRLGVIVTAGSEIYMLGNLIRSIHHTESDYDPGSIYAGGVGIHARNSGSVYALHNTLHDCDGPITTNTTLAIHGNIFSNIAEALSHHINAEVAANVTANHNLYMQSDAAPRIRWNGATYDFNGFRTSTGQEADGQEGDAAFLSAGSDFRLGPASAALDIAGPLHDAFETFAQRYGLQIDSDMHGGARLLGGGADAGAFER